MDNQTKGSGVCSCLYSRWVLAHASEDQRLMARLYVLRRRTINAQNWGEKETVSPNSRCFPRWELSKSCWVNMSSSPSPWSSGRTQAVLPCAKELVPCSDSRREQHMLSPQWGRTCRVDGSPLIPHKLTFEVDPAKAPFLAGLFVGCRTWASSRTGVFYHHCPLFPSPALPQSFLCSLPFSFSFLYFFFQERVLVL